MRTLTSILPILILPISAVAADYDCHHGNLHRHIEIVYEPGLAVPCEVHYYRDASDRDNREVLWRAQNEAGYCEARTDELVAKLESMGWQCSVAGADDDDAGDETDDLAPQDESGP